MGNKLKLIAEQMNFEMTNIITHLSSEDHEELVDLFLDKINAAHVNYESIIIDSKELIMGLKNFRRSLEKTYTDEELFSMNLEQLKKASTLFKNEMYAYYKNIYEEYIALTILLKMSCKDTEREIYTEQKRIIEDGNFDALLQSSSKFGSIYFYNGSRKRIVHTLIFLTDAQFVVDFNLQDAINNFIDLNTDFFKFNVLTEMDTILDREYGFHSRDVQIINGQEQKIHKKNTK